MSWARFSVSIQGLLSPTAGEDMIPQHMKRLISLSLIAAACLFLSVHPDAQQAGSPRIVAVADIHGGASGLADILRAAGLIDAGGKWTGGNTRLVQTGDFLDRGADVRAAMDLLMRLESEARRAGGRVDVLFGNHEGMNVLRDFRDVSPQAMATFADKRSEDRRKRAFETHAGIAKRAGNELSRDIWMAAHPLGFVEYVDAIGPSGQYGRWIRARKPILQIGDIIFMHAGLHPERTQTVEEVNRAVELEVRGWDDFVTMLERAKLVAPFFNLQEIVNVAQVEIGKIAVAQKSQEPVYAEYVTPQFIGHLQRLQMIDKWALIESDGPLWYRGLALLPDDQKPAIDALLRRLNARRFMTGHTPQLPGGRVKLRFGGAVILMDTGMLTSYFKGGQPSAVEIKDGKLTAIYTSGREPLD
jgi:hypothetical protein